MEVKPAPKQVLQVYFTFNRHKNASDLQKMKVLVDNVKPNYYSPEAVDMTYKKREQYGNKAASFFMLSDCSPLPLEYCWEKAEKKKKPFHKDQSFQLEELVYSLNRRCRSFPLEAHGKTSRKDNVRMLMDSLSLVFKLGVAFLAFKPFKDSAKKMVWGAIRTFDAREQIRERDIISNIATYLDDAQRHFNGTIGEPLIRMVANFGSFHYPMFIRALNAYSGNPAIQIMPCEKPIAPNPVHRIIIDIREAIATGLKFDDVKVQSILDGFGTAFKQSLRDKG